MTSKPSATAAGSPKPPRSPIPPASAPTAFSSSTATERREACDGASVTPLADRWTRGSGWRRSRTRSRRCSPRVARSRRRPTSSRRPASPTPDVYAEADADPEAFWAQQAGELLDWYEPWHTVLEWDLPVRQVVPRRQAQRVLQLPRPPRRRRSRRQGRVPLGGRARRHPHHHLRRISSHDVVAARQRAEGARRQKGDRVNIYLGMVPELPMALLACARIGAAHSVVFGGFSSDSLRDRIQDAGAKVLITGDGAWRRGSIVAAEGDRRRRGRRVPDRSRRCSCCSAPSRTSR